MDLRTNHGVVPLVLAVAGGIVLGGVALAVFFWAVGVVFHLAFVAARLAFFAAAVAAVWWLVAGRRGAPSS